MIKSYYYQFVNFLQNLNSVWFFVIWMVLLAMVFLCIARFFKVYNGTQKKFEKVSLIIVALILLAILIFLTYIRK